MRYKITGRNINVTPGLKAAVEEKIGKLERYFNQDTEVNITLTMYNRARQAAITQEITEVCGGAAAQRREREEEMRV